MQQKNILIVDDEVKIVEVVSSLLQSCGYRVFEAFDGESALQIFKQENISLVILDLMLPKYSGEEVCKIIRQTSRVPIIMLTAKVQEENIVEGFACGADDYVSKPFRLKELKARIQALLRRTCEDFIPLYKKNAFNNNDLVVDFDSNIILKKGQEVKITATEMKILATLIKYPNKVFTREELIALVFADDYDGYSRAIDTHIKNLRQKIEDDPKNCVYIVTIHGRGYRFGVR